MARVPVRATFAFAGAGSLGTFLSAAAREVLTAMREHNVAVRSGAPNDDPRLLNDHWGPITIDALGGSSAGALCASQVVKSLFDPSYLNIGGAIDASHTFTGDWVRGGDFARLAVEGNTPTQAGPIEAPGWTLISGARLFELASNALAATPDANASRGDSTLADDLGTLLDPSGIVGIGVTLTDLLGYHAPAEFEPDRVLGHPSFGMPAIQPSEVVGRLRQPSRDLGGRGHAEVRKLFIARDADGVERARSFLEASARRGRARAAQWGAGATERLAALAASSAALPLAVGPLAMTDRAGDASATVRRLYMDGGILNNKPIAPALKLARWHEAARLSEMLRRQGQLSHEQVSEELVYERVCFFFDAFPDRTRDEWRSAHPDMALKPTGVFQLTHAATEARDSRIDEALAVPTAALDVFFESMLTSLRAQDILGIAKANDRLRARDAFIDTRVDLTSDRDRPFELDTVEKAQALGAVLSRPGGASLDPVRARKIAERVWESDQYSGLAGRRQVTMVPVFAPDNLKAVLAGEGLYAVGGLLDINARQHDASVGTRVAREVLRGLRSPPPAPTRLPSAPESALPSDTGQLVARLRVSSIALIDAIGRRPNPVRFFAKLPLQLTPFLQMAKRRLDKAVRSPGDPLEPKSPKEPE